MKLHWRDVKNREQEWAYLEVNILDAPKPTLRLYSGAERRFKLVGQDQVFFWGNMQHDYEGAWFLRNDNQWDLEQMPVPPITSSDVQESSSLSGDELMAFWCRYFTRRLRESKVSPLYEGKWQLSHKGNYIEFEEYALAADPVRPENKLGFYETRPIWVDWGMSGSYILLALKALPNEDEGRVKWWRKQVRQDSCPPVLIWFIHGLYAYVVLDGHARLRAYQLEGKPPKFITLSSVIEHEVELNPKRIEGVYKNLANRQKNPRKNPLSLEAINQLLLDIFDTTPLVQGITKAKASAYLTEEWYKEVKSFSGLPGSDEGELESMLND